MKTPAERARDAQVAFYRLLLNKNKCREDLRANLDSVLATAEMMIDAGIKTLASHKTFSNRYPEFFNRLEGKLWRLVEIGASPMVIYEKMGEAMRERGFSVLYTQTAARKAVETLEVW
jgi:hypothetical protein